MNAKTHSDSRLLHGVEVLAAVIQTGSFARAGQALGLTQSAVSRAIARLEARLGVRLLDRTTRSLAPTTEGRQLYDRLLPLLEEFAEAAAEASGAAVRPRGSLRVHADSYFASLIFAPHAARFLALYPEITLELQTRTDLGDIIGEGFDIAVRFGEPASSSLVVRKLLETRVLTVAAPSYLKHYGRPATPQDLRQHQCIHFREPATGRPFLWEFHRGRQIVAEQGQQRLLVNDVASLLNAALSGAGIAQALAPCVRDHLRAGRLIEIFPDWPGERFPLYALYPSRRLPAARLRAFIDFVVKIAQEHETQE
jgi:DNA-binding transcriptional LysR family regulator